MGTLHSNYYCSTESEHGVRFLLNMIQTNILLFPAPPDPTQTKSEAGERSCPLPVSSFAHKLPSPVLIYFFRLSLPQNLFFYLFVSSRKQTRQHCTLCDQIIQTNKNSLL